MFLLNKISALWKKPEPIETSQALKNFLVKEIAKVTSELVIKYAIKRLGRLHYRFAKDPNYIQELVECQVKLHAEILADFSHLVARLMNFENVKECASLKALVQTVHEDYVKTAPEGTRVHACLTEHHFAKGHIKVRDLALIRGEFLYKILPMTENLYAANVTIFQGQMRTAYIGLLEKIGRRAHYELLRKDLNGD